MKQWTFFLIVLAAVGLSGCGEPPIDPNAVKNPSKAEMDAAMSRRNEAIAIYERAGGKWENMSPEDKARLIELSGGNETIAQQGWGALGAMSRR